MLACVLVVGLRQPLQASVRKAAESGSEVGGDSAHEDDDLDAFDPATLRSDR